jgi:hypothetical protein
VIEREEFTEAWAHLCDRFGREPDPRQAHSYLKFLDESGMDTPAFLVAARTIWATAKWFPRPADFLLVGAAGEWSTVLGAVSAYNPPEAGWVEHWRALSPRALAACNALGGIAGMRAIYDRDVLRLKAGWEQAYEQETAAAVLALPAPAPRQLRPA